MDALSVPRRIELPDPDVVPAPDGHYGVVDVFCGSGAFTYGLKRGGLRGPALLLDVEADCTRTASLNNRDSVTLTADATRVDWGRVSAEVLVGGPPCQGFSNLGARDDQDPRNNLYQEVLRAASALRPKIIVIENVPRFVKGRHGAALVEGMSLLGYAVRSGVVDAASFGVPQRRKRGLIVASATGLAVPWPTPTHGRSLRPVRTVGDALALLPRDPDGKNWHRSPSVSEIYEERIRSIPANGNRTDLPSDLELECWRRTPGHTDVMGRLSWTQPSTTIRTEFFRPEKGRFLHPVEDRPLTMREGARLQGFPDSFVFPEDIQPYPLARQIGNAIPPPLATAIGRAIADVLPPHHITLPS